MNACVQNIVTSDKGTVVAGSDACCPDFAIDVAGEPNARCQHRRRVLRNVFDETR